VYTVAFSADGGRLASTGGDNRVAIWRVATGQLERALHFPDRALAIAFTPSGDLLVGGQAGELRIVHSADGTIERRIETQTSLWSVAVSPDGRIAATTGPLRLWDLANGNRVPGPASYGLLGVAYSADGKLLMTGEPTGGASILSVESASRRDTLHLWEQKPMPGRTGYDKVSVDMPASAIALSRLGNYAAAGGSDRVVHLWPLLPSRVDEANRRRLVGHTMSVTAVAFSPDGKWLVSGSLDRTVRVWPLH
jgi:WD40 repeat protein